MSVFSRLLIAGITAALFLLLLYACMDASAPAEGADAIINRRSAIPSDTPLVSRRHCSNIVGNAVDSIGLIANVLTRKSATFGDRNADRERYLAQPAVRMMVSSGSACATSV